MQFESLPALALASLGSLALLTAGVNLLRGSLYDLQSFKKSGPLRDHPHAAKFRKRPLIDVVIIAHNSEADVARCLDSMYRGSYRKYNIVVLNNASKDNTSMSVKQWQIAHPKVSLKLSNSRKVSTTEQLLGRALQFTRGEIIVVLEAEQTIDKQLLKGVLEQFALHDAGGLEFSGRIIAEPSLLNLLQRFEYVVCHRLHKGRSWTYKRSKSVLRKPAAYRRSSLRALLKMNRRSSVRMHYADNLSVYSGASRSYVRLIMRHTRQRRLLLGIVWLGGCAVTSYLLYLALYLKTPAWYGVVWAAVSLLLILIIGSSDYIPSASRLRLILLAPLAASLLYIISLVEVAVWLITILLKTLTWPIKQVV